MTDEERDKLAREVIAQAAVEWENKSDAYVDVVNNTPRFVFVLHSHEAFNGKDCSHADTIIQYNPYIELIEGMKSDELKLKLSKTPQREQPHLIKYYASTQLDVMLKLAQRHFADALWQLPIVASTTTQCQILEIFGRYDLRKGFVKASLNLLAGRWEDRWQTRRNVKATHHKVSDFGLRTAIQKLGGRPSQRKTAAELGVSEKLLRDFLRTRGIEGEEDWKSLLDILETEERELKARRDQIREEVRRNRGTVTPIGRNEGSESP